MGKPDTRTRDAVDDVRPAVDYVTVDTVVADPDGDGWLRSRSNVPADQLDEFKARNQLADEFDGDLEDRPHEPASWETWLADDPKDEA